MKKQKHSWLYWTPRILGIIFAFFISIFALDVFVEYKFPEVLVALFMHLVPTYLVVGALLVAWKWERIGGILFLGLGLFYIIMTWGKFEGMTYLIIAGPVILIGILFLISSLRKTKKKN